MVEQNNLCVEFDSAHQSTAHNTYRAPADSMIAPFAQSGLSIFVAGVSGKSGSPSSGVTSERNVLILCVAVAAYKGLNAVEPIAAVIPINVRRVTLPARYARSSRSLKSKSFIGEGVYKWRSRPVNQLLDTKRVYLARGCVRS